MKENKELVYNYFYLLKYLIICINKDLEEMKFFYVFHKYMKAIDKHKYHSIINIFDPESNASPL